MVSAAAIQAGILFWGLYRTQNFHYSLTFSFKHPGVWKIISLMTPLVLTMFFYRAVPVFDRFFLSKLPEGSISHIGYAQKLISAIPPIISSGIALTVFPKMSQFAAEKNWTALRHVMSKAVGILFYLSIPVTLFIGLFGQPFVRIIFEKGAFSSSDTTSVFSAFSIYLIALPAMTTGSVIGQGFYVLQDTKTPGIVGIFEVLFYFLLVILFLPSLAYLSIPTAFAIYFNLSLLINALIVRHRLGGHGGMRILSSVTKHVFSAALCIFPMFYILRGVYSDLFFIFLILMAFLLYFLISFFIIPTDEGVYFKNRLFPSKMK